MNAVAVETLPGSYYDNALQTRALRLLPAEYRASAESVALVTLLGSCVAACLHDPAIGLGGMNHFMLPGGSLPGGSLPGGSLPGGSLPGGTLPGGTPQGGDVACSRYGVHAMELLINDMLKRGARRQRLRAKVFGGGNVLRGFHNDPIGTRNASFVLEYLEAERIPVLAQDMGDVHPRKVCFFVQTGRTLVKRLPAAHQDDIARVERDLYGKLARAPASGSVELF